MNFFDTKIDNQMRWMGVLIIGEFTVIIATIVFYFAVFPNTLYSLGFGIILSAIPVTYLVSRLEKKNGK